MLVCGQHEREQQVSPTLETLGAINRRACRHAGEDAASRVDDDRARKVWESVYPKLSEGRDGLLGSATARAEAQCLRLALLYALLDEQPEIDVAHVLAGIAVWEYCDATARFVFGDAIGDRVADDIRRALLRSWDTGMSRTDIRNLFNRHESGERIEQALDLLDKRGQVRRERRNTGGRPEDIWYAGGATEATYATKAGESMNLWSLMSHARGA